MNPQLKIKNEFFNEFAPVEKNVNALTETYKSNASMTHEVKKPIEPSETVTVVKASMQL